MYHKSAIQIANERIIIPDPDVQKAGEVAKRVVSDYGPITDINSYILAHIQLGKACEEQKNEKSVASALTVMCVIEELVTQAIIGPDRITIIKFK